MTVTYTREVATQKVFGVFWKLLFRWRGSIYKLVWPELFVYVALYYLLRFVYQFAMTVTQKRLFEQLCIHVQEFGNLIPISFVLGFYVSVVMDRWWQQYRTLPWPNSLAVFVSTSLHGQDQRGRLMRRTIMRYANLSYVLTLSMICPQVKKRFPTLDHVVEAGFMNDNEKKIVDHMNEQSPLSKYWMPLIWAGSIVARARKEGRIRDDFAVKTIIDTINEFRSCCGTLLGYDTISVPLVYTQVVTLAVYSFCLASLFGSQFLDPTQNYPKNGIDLYVPWFTLLQFFFYMGWLKVAETLLNPFGEDDDDFEINGMIDRNLQASYLIVDGMHNEHPQLIQDIYWDEGIPQEIPYTVASEQFKTEAPKGSTADIEVTEHGQEFLPTLAEENEELTGVDSGLESALQNNFMHSNGKKARSRPGSKHSTASKRSIVTRLLNKIKPSTENIQKLSSGRSSRANSLSENGDGKRPTFSASSSKSSRLTNLMNSKNNEENIYTISDDFEKKDFE